jgi:hypothetical protein
VSRRFLEDSFDLYRSVPFVDSRRSSEVVKRSLESRMQATGGHGVPPLQLLPGPPAYSDSIDATFDALMEYAPKSHVAVC